MAKEYRVFTQRVGSNSTSIDGASFDVIIEQGWTPISASVFDVSTKDNFGDPLGCIVAYISILAFRDTVQKIL